MSRGRELHRVTSCTGKVRFDSFALAERARTRPSKRRGAVARSVYHCKLCNGYHLGCSVPKSARQRVPRETIR